MKLKNSETDFFATQIIEWYATNRRSLPWRDINDPYRIWLSEVILQQTRVAQGLAYYERFVARFPDICALADADEEEVLKLWQGLGYYSRARNLHAAARSVRDNFDGIFPCNYNDIRALQGVGDYTAAAIASFAYNKPHAVLDGNVFRVLSRVFGIETPIDSGTGKREFALLADSLLDRHCPALYNQAIMDFGALQCLPIAPRCIDCPLNAFCEAYRTQKTAFFPQKKQKTKQRNRFFNYFLIQYENNVYLQKRTHKDVWQHLYEFPLIETAAETEWNNLIQTDDYRYLFESITEIEITAPTFAVKHVLSHQTIWANFYSLKISNENEPLKKRLKILINELNNYPVARLTELFLNKMYPFEKKELFLANEF